MRLQALVTALAFLGIPVAASAGQTPSPEGAKSHIISPKDGATVRSPVVVQLGLKGMGVAPADVEWPDTGHHHILINISKLPDPDTKIPKDDQHIHRGGGQTEAVLDLAPGTYTLRSVLGDHRHLLHNPPVFSDLITITVE